MARKICFLCNLRPTGSGKGHDAQQAFSMGYCNPCLTEADWENRHNDDGHVAYHNDSIEVEDDRELANLERDVKDCWTCVPELNEAKKPYAKRTVKGHNSPRRTQLNHGFCMHAATPKARRECRNAFWATQEAAEAFTAYRDGVWLAAGYVNKGGKWVPGKSKGKGKGKGKG